MLDDVGDTSISIPVGITIGLLASCVQSLGLTIQRKSHVLNQALPDGEQRVEHRRPLWLIGFAIFISSNILGSLFQIASLPVVILAPLGAVSLLWNAFFARFLLGDVFSPWMILGTLLVAGGAVLIAVFGIVPEPNHSLDDLLRLFARPTFVAYFTSLGVVVFFWLAITHIVEYSFKRSHRVHLSPSPPLSPTLLPTDAVTTQLVTENTPLIDRKRSISAASSPPSSISIDTRPPKLDHTLLMLSLSYASISGILSGMCLLFAKSGVELLVLTLKGHNQFWRWEAWMLVLGLVVFALLQLWYLHKGLVLADPTLVCPLAFCFYNLSSIINGLVYFDQFAVIPTRHLLLVILGIVVLLGGVWVVSVYAGGGRVDVGTWDDELVEAVTSPIEFGDVTGLRDEVSIHGPSGSQESEEFSPEDYSPAYSQHARSQTDSHLLSPNLSRSVDLPLSPNSFQARSKRRLTVADPMHGSYSSNNYPVSPPLPPGGFSIGLSPVSPGFSVVPKERRRRVSGMGPPSTGKARAGGSIRRTVSDGDVRDLTGGPGLDAERHEDQNEGVDRYPPAEDIEGGKIKARGRWKWLRSLLRRPS
ncbi:hypothetical protein JAAARDRAFT_29562 [Jaapia argillacea MUCL 33604]|uniref:Magnesium transporter NIPA-domain-containing protein n=1 Tax=Jaapia argillacea MUCL 33604 TaxID=933084 RepID=A0A067QBK9_9AGAM|nr:hypothetical protein JAAARDRAFT_29562 [Jaapia argillacea MUCL 33604]